MNIAVCPRQEEFGLQPSARPPQADEEKQLQGRLVGNLSVQVFR